MPSLTNLVGQLEAGTKAASSQLLKAVFPASNWLKTTRLVKEPETCLTNLVGQLEAGTKAASSQLLKAVFPASNWLKTTRLVKEPETCF